MHMEGVQEFEEYFHQVVQCQSFNHFLNFCEVVSLLLQPLLHPSGCNSVLHLDTDK